MSDARDAVQAARVQNEKLAASCTVRKESLVGEIKALEQQRASAAELAGVRDPNVSGEAAAILRAIDERLSAKRAELAVADADLRQALTELRELEKLKGKAIAADAKAVAASALQDDPIIRSAEQVSLDNVRAHISNLEIQARIGAELSSVQPLVDPLRSSDMPDAAPSPAVPPAATAPGGALPPAARSPGLMTDAEARAKFEEMRAKPGTPGAEPKKTL